MITLFKQRGSLTTASHISFDELVQMIREQKYGRELATYREVWPLQKVSRMDDDDVMYLTLLALPHAPSW